MGIMGTTDIMAVIAVVMIIAGNARKSPTLIDTQLENHQVDITTNQEQSFNYKENRTWEPILAMTQIMLKPQLRNGIVEIGGTRLMVTMNGAVGQW
jgi:hypothetical protein